VISILLAPMGFAISLPLLVYMIYSLRRDGLHGVPAALRCLKWIAITCSLVIIVNAGIFVGQFAYLARNSCDNSRPYPLAESSHGNRAEGQIETCTLIGTTINYSVTLQTHTGRRIWLRKTLIAYSPVGDHDPILRWIDDDTLSVDLGKVSWVSPRLDKAGSVRIFYSYIMVD
jgi:hypothetical protein